MTPCRTLRMRRTGVRRTRALVVDDCVRCGAVGGGGGARRGGGSSRASHQCPRAVWAECWIGGVGLECDSSRRARTRLLRGCARGAASRKLARHGLRRIRARDRFSSLRFRSAATRPGSERRPDLATLRARRVLGRRVPVLVGGAKMLAARGPPRGKQSQEDASDQRDLDDQSTFAARRCSPKDASARGLRPRSGGRARPC